MSNILETLKKTLPFEESQDANRKRTLVWERWDTNSFGFLSLSDIKVELIDLFDFTDNSHLNTVINLAYKRVKQLSQRVSNFNGQFLQRRYFRMFIQSFTKSFQALILFEQFDTDKDNRLNANELLSVKKSFKNLNLEPQKLTMISELSNKNELYFQVFLNWMNQIKQDTYSHLF